MCKCIISVEEVFCKVTELKKSKKSTRKSSAAVGKAISIGILYGFSKVLPNSHFRNAGIKRNWSNIYIIFFANSMKY